MTLKRSYFLVGAISFAASFSTANAETFKSDTISFRDITGSIEIQTTTGDEIDISIVQGKKYAPIELRDEGGVVVVTGERWRDDETRNCCDQRITREFHARKDRKLSTGEPFDQAFFNDYPTIKVSMPFNGNVDFVDARIKLAMERLRGRLSLDACYVYGETSDVGEAVIGVIDGSRLVMGNIGGALELDISGDADVKTGDVAMVDIDIAGPGDVVLGAVDGMLDVSIAGSGIVRSTYVDAPVTVRIAGSGGLAVKGGKADRLRVNIDGSGGVYFGGEVTQPDLRLYGSSEVRMQSVKGRITHFGGGDVYVGDKVFEDD